MHYRRAFLKFTTFVLTSKFYDFFENIYFETSDFTQIHPLF